MKNLILCTIFSLVVTNVCAQVNLDKTYDFSAASIKLETAGYKYFLMDVPNSQCRLYNLDHSLYKTINCNVPADFYLSDIKFISENLFDDDEGIELLYTYYKYEPVEDSYYYVYNSEIINEDGSRIRFIEGGRFNYIYETGEEIYKLFSYCFDYSVFPETVWTHIFNLPEHEVINTFANYSIQEPYLNAYPNPASYKIKVEYSLPENFDIGRLHLFDNNGKAIQQFEIDGHSDHLSLDISQYGNGIYYYFIEYGGTKTPSKKLVVGR